MTQVIPHVRRRLPDECFTTRYARDGCSVSVAGAPTPHVVIDMDHPSLSITNDTRCDYLFLSDADSAPCVAPIEMKRGSLSATHVVDQLQAGADLADKWLPHLPRFKLVPILAHNGLPKAERDRLRKGRVRFKRRRVVPVAIRCGSPIAAHLNSRAP